MRYGEYSKCCVMEWAGMEREGVMRHHRLYRGEWWGTVLYGLVRDHAG